MPSCRARTITYAHVAGFGTRSACRAPTSSSIPPAPRCLAEIRARSTTTRCIGTRMRRSLGYFFDTPFASKRAWVVDPWSDDLAPCADLRRGAPQLGASGRSTRPVLTRGDEEATNRWLDSMSYGDLIVRELGLSKDVFRLSDPLVATGDYRREFGRGFRVRREAARPARDRGLHIREPTKWRSPFRAAMPRSCGISSRRCCPMPSRGTRAFADVLFAPINFDALDRPQHTRIRLAATAVAVRHDGPPEPAGEVNVTYALDGELARVRGKAVHRRGRRLDRPSYRARLAGLLCGGLRAVSSWSDPGRQRGRAQLEAVRETRHLRRTLVRWLRFLRERSPADENQWGCRAARPGEAGDADVVCRLSPSPGFPSELRPARGAPDCSAPATRISNCKSEGSCSRCWASAGFDARRDIAGIVINRWGHAYIAPQPGFYFGSPGNPAPLEVIRERHGRIAFGHSELSGRQSWGRAAKESRRALSQVLEVLA